MAEVLALRGGSALSPFRIQKLLAALSATRSSHAITGIGAQFWHFVEIDGPLDATGRATLDSLLTYGPADRPAIAGDASLIVVPRFGTISPWSSKATDIARNCNLDSVLRIERGVAFHVSTRAGAPLGDDDRSALLPLIHDRMTETVLFDVDEANRLFEHVPPRPLSTIPLRARGRAALEDANAELGLALSGDEIAYL